MSKVGKFKDWLNEVKHVDDLQRMERTEFEVLAKATHHSSRCTNTLTEPSRHTNANYNTAASSYLSSTCVSLPKLTDAEHKLLYDNNGCLKCRCVFIQHHSPNCPNDFPDATTYKTLTQTFIDYIKQCTRKPIATVMMNNEVHTSTSTTPQPVAVMMGVSQNPVVYMPSNTSNVIEGDSNSDCSVSPSHPVSLAATVPELLPPPTLTALTDELASLTVSHLFWQCSISGPTDCLPVSFTALIDHGSHIVLIRSDLVNSLNLKHRKLYEPMSVEIAMAEGNKKHVVELNQ